MQHGYEDMCPYVTPADFENIEAARKRESDKKLNQHLNANQISIENNLSDQIINRIETKSSNSNVILEENELSFKVNRDYSNRKSDYKNNSREKTNHDNSNSIISVNLNFDDIVNSIIHLAKTNKEFYALQIFFVIWLFLVVIEFTYGYMESLSNVISDSFFNLFKIFSFLITGTAIYFNRYFNFRIKLLNERFESIAALSNLVFLTIVSIIMFITSLHLITEEEQKDHLHSSNEFGHDQEQYTIDVFKFFYLIKVILNVVALIAFGDYIVHPHLQIKINLMKKYKKWVRGLDELSLADLQENDIEIKKWNNHFDNVNCMIINVLTDLISSFAFLICFYFSNDNHFEYIYFFISCLNLAIVFLFVFFIFGGVIDLLMQARQPIIAAADKVIQREVGLFEGCLGIKEVRYWMISNNSVKCFLKIYGSKDLNMISLKQKLDNFRRECYIDIKIILDVSI